MAVERRNIRSVSKLISKRAVSVGTKFLLDDDINKSFETKLEELWLSKQEAMTIFVDEIDKIREEVKLQLHHFLDSGKRDGVLKFVQETQLQEIIEVSMSPSQSSSEEKSVTLFPSLDLSNLRESPPESTRKSHRTLNDTGRSSQPKVLESPDFVEVSDSSIESSAIENLVYRLKVLSPGKKLLDATSDSIVTEKNGEKIEEATQETCRTSSSSFYSVPSTDCSNNSAGECKPWKNAKAIPVLLDGSVLRSPRVLENDDLEQEMQCSFHRLSDSSDEILSALDRSLNQEMRWIDQTPKIIQVDISSSFSSNHNIEVISARSLETSKK